MNCQHFFYVLGQWARLKLYCFIDADMLLITYSHISTSTCSQTVYRLYAVNSLYLSLKIIAIVQIVPHQQGYPNISHVWLLLTAGDIYRTGLIIHQKTLYVIISVNISIINIKRQTVMKLQLHNRGQKEKNNQ